MNCPRRLSTALAGPLLVFGLDLLRVRALRRGWSRAAEGVIDEAAHLATAAVLLAPWRAGRTGPWALGALAGAILIDVDHVPGELGRWWIALPGERPYTHTALIPLALVMFGRRAGGWRRPALFGTGAGLATHLLRDLALGGCRLAWPVRKDTVSLPYWPYAISLVAAALAWRHRLTPRSR
jgi:membrane-bound metal-dependent hydrolase YbcI (DUF457 family)